MRAAALAGLLLFAAGCARLPQAQPVPVFPLVRLDGVDATIQQEMRYFGTENFVGARVDGYEAPACWLSRPAAEALARVQAEVQPFGLSLRVFDCYRPQRAVNHFARWAADPSATAMKASYYPAVPKDSLFAWGYIAARSGHSRGSTVDLTLVPAGAGAAPGPAYKACADGGPLDMGTGFDCFSPRSATASPAVTPQQRANRLLLKAVMERHGFRNYSAEWWHYTLRDEPFPETYFDEPVR